jgi:hypothetical protein
MASALNESKQSQQRVHPGLLLVFILAVALAILDKTGLMASLPSAPATANRVTFLAATTAIGFGWFFLFKDPKPSRPILKWVTVVVAVVLTLSVTAYFQYTVVPLKFIFRSRPLTAVAMFLARRRDVLDVVGLIGPFIGWGRSRVAFVVGGTPMFLLWTTTWRL